MHSRAAAAGFLLLTCTSCGILGGKDDPGSTLDFPTPLTGCLDNTGERLTKYLNGSIDPNDWKLGLDCTNDSLRLLNKYGGSDGGYTQENVRSLIQSLVLTDQQIPDDFIPAVFQLKASLLGGSKDLLTVAETEQIMKLISVIRDESLKILPLLKARAQEANPTNEIALSRALALANANVGLALPKLDATSAALTVNAAKTLFRDLGTILKWNIPTYVPDVLFSAKTLLLGGSPEAIEAENWQVGFATLGAIGAPIFAMLDVDKSKVTGPNGYGEYLLTIANDFESAMEKAIDKRGGVIPSVDVDRLIDAIPSSLLPIAISTPTLIKTVHVGTGKVLGAAEPGGLDKPSLQRGLEILGRWQRGKTYIDSIYAQSGLDVAGVSQAALLSAINNYKATAPAANQPDLDRLATIVTSYRPLFMGENDSEISLMPESTYTKNHLTQLHWINLVAELALNAYSSAADRSFITESDIEGAYSDLVELGSELDVIDPNIQTFAADRFREADFYMPDGDGNGELTLEDLTYYIAYIKSIGANAKRMRNDIEESCKISDTRGPMGWKPQDPTCFRRMYFSNVESYWNHAPAMVNYFESLGKSDGGSIEHDYEQVARLKGYSEEPLGGFDAKAFPAALHYVETMMMRFDHDGNGSLNTNEAIDSSMLFAGAIGQNAGLNPDTDLATIQAIYTYIIKKGKEPDAQPLGTIEIAAWLIGKPFWNIDAPRTDLYRALAVFQTAALQNH